MHRRPHFGQARLAEKPRPKVPLFHVLHRRRVVFLHFKERAAPFHLADVIGKRRVAVFVKVLRRQPHVAALLVPKKPARLRIRPLHNVIGRPARRKGLAQHVVVVRYDVRQKIDLGLILPLAGVGARHAAWISAANEEFSLWCAGSLAHRIHVLEHLAKPRLPRGGRLRPERAHLAQKMLHTRELDGGLRPCLGVGGVHGHPARNQFGRGEHVPPIVGTAEVARVEKEGARRGRAVGILNHKVAERASRVGVRHAALPVGGTTGVGVAARPSVSR